VGEAAVPSFHGPTICTRLENNQIHIEEDSPHQDNNGPVTVDMDILNG
jgi:hypothetical protein